MAAPRQGLPVRLERAPHRGAAFALSNASKRARIRSRLIPAEERAAFLEMRAHQLRGRELTEGELRRVSERAWRTFLEHRWQIHDPEDAA